MTSAAIVGAITMFVAWLLAAVTTWLEYMEWCDAVSDSADCGVDVSDTGERRS